MSIEQFIVKSLGQWRSMRSGHSIAFKQFEQIVSEITIKLLSHNDPNVLNLLKSSDKEDQLFLSPFQIDWEAESDWIQDDNKHKGKGSTILIPFPKNNSNGFLLRSMGYAEAITSISSYRFLNDGTFVISTTYENTITEERIWFLSDFVRCRSSVIFTGKKSGILQTSFASEIKTQTT